MEMLELSRLCIVVTRIFQQEALGAPVHVLLDPQTVTDKSQTRCQKWHPEPMKPGQSPFGTHPRPVPEPLAT